LRWMAEGRWEDEVARIAAGVWVKTTEAIRNNPYRDRAEVDWKAESRMALNAMAAALGAVNQQMGVTGGRQ